MPCGAFKDFRVRVLILIPAPDEKTVESHKRRRLPLPFGLISEEEIPTFKRCFEHFEIIAWLSHSAHWSFALFRDCMRMYAAL